MRENTHFFGWCHLFFTHSKMDWNWYMDLGLKAFSPWLMAYGGIKEFVCWWTNISAQGWAVIYIHSCEWRPLLHIQGPLTFKGRLSRARPSYFKMNSNYIMITCVFDDMIIVPTTELGEGLVCTLLGARGGHDIAPSHKYSMDHSHETYVK